MKFAIGLMACIAIAFVIVTSPESQPRASVEPISAETQAITSLTSAVESLQDSIAEQRESLDQRIDDKFVAFTESLPAPASAPDILDLEADVQNLQLARVEMAGDIAVLRGELQEIREATATKAAAASCPCPNCQCPGGACPGGQCPTAKPATAVQSVSAAPVNYSPRWHNNDGRSLRDHAVMEHGFDPNLSDAQLAAQHDAYHDQYGPTAPSAAMRSKSVMVQSPFTTSNCPGGQCPTSGMSRTRTVQSRGGLLGFGVFGRR